METRVPAYLATYDLRDIENPYLEFTRQARRNGWSVLINSDDGRTFGLPNTTLTGVFDDMEAAHRSLSQTVLDTEAAIRAPVRVTSYIICDWNNAIFNSDFIR